MLRNITNRKFVLILALGGALAGLGLYGCTSNQSTPAAPGAAATTEPSFALFGPPPKKSGVQLWSDNCMRCHNGRPPQTFSAAQWATVVHHMRLRANLTGDEEREIVKFLQASN
jgi:hypothetical protein